MKAKPRLHFLYMGKGDFGAGGFEPPTSCSQGRHANQAAPRPDIIFSEGNLLVRGGLCNQFRPGGSEAGALPISLARYTRTSANARARWLILFFTSGPSSARVLPY